MSISEELQSSNSPASSAVSTVGPSFSDRLHQWYLARLRRRALADSRGLTPAALIQADRALINSLVIGSSEQTALTGNETSPSFIVHYFRVAGAIWLAVLVLAIAGLWGCYAFNSAAGPALYKATVGLLLFQTGLDTSVGNHHHWALAVSASLFFYPFVVALLGNFLSLILIKGTVRFKSALPFLLTIALLSLLPIISLFMLTAPQTHPGASIASSIVLGEAAWSLVVGTATLLNFGLHVLRPLHELILVLAKSPSTSKQSACPDIDNLKNIAQEILRSRDEFENRERLIAEVSSDMICALGSDLRILCTASSCMRLMGYLPEELVGIEFQSLASLSGAMDRTQSAVNSARETRQPVTFENRMLSKAQHAVDFRWTVEWSDTEKCYFACGEDITDRKTLERARQEFMTTISHDIKVPLGAAYANIDSVHTGLYGELSKAGSEALERAQRGLNRVLALLRDLLEFEQLSEGKTQLVCKPVALIEILEEATEEVSELAARKRIDLLNSAGSVVVQVDRNKILRTVVNLLSNAIKYSPEETTVSITTADRPPFVELRITDQGIGVAEQFRSLIFDRYERLAVDGAQTEGTGLGLAIAKAIVLEHGGMIGCDSAPHQGSTFWFTVPRAKP